MVKGTIYHDTSSKGWKNGKQVFKDCWRAEITIDGKRYRFRSKSCKECEQWLKEKRQTIPASFREIINFPDYYMDRSNGRVYHRYSGMLRRLRTYGKLTIRIICMSICAQEVSRIAWVITACVWLSI